MVTVLTLREVTIHHGDRAKSLDIVSRLNEATLGILGLTGQSSSHLHRGRIRQKRHPIMSLLTEKNRLVTQGLDVGDRKFFIRYLGLLNANHCGGMAIDHRLELMQARTNTVGVKGNQSHNLSKRLTGFILPSFPLRRSTRCGDNGCRIAAP